MDAEQEYRDKRTRRGSNDPLCEPLGGERKTSFGAPDGLTSVCRVNLLLVSGSVGYHLHVILRVFERHPDSENVVR